MFQFWEVCKGYWPLHTFDGGVRGGCTAPAPHHHISNPGRDQQRHMAKLSLPAKSILTSQAAFCTGAAALMVLLRLISFDYRFFFNLQSVPNHDMYQGAAFFATSMHSMRLSGDIVWWNPTSDNGYAQYYQSFFSPLAPTSNHIIFIAWAQIIRILSLSNIYIPEYFQYLIINYIIFPFATFLGLAAFSSLIFYSRITVLIVLTVYTLSGIGLWNSAWFYFQESSSLFLLLAASIAVLKKTNLHRLMLFLIAILVQITSLNYWTIYNSWFIAILLGVYSWSHPNQLRRLCLRVSGYVRRYKAQSIIVLVAVVLVVGLWTAVIGSIVLEQSQNYIRAVGDFSIMDAYDRVQEIRKFTTELFNPDIYKALQSYKLENDMHNARYIGVFLLPFLTLIPFYTWRRRDKFIIVSSFAVLIVCLASPILLTLWEHIPFMDRIRHLFYFYTHFWQFMVLLLAATSMDGLFRATYSKSTKRKFTLIIYTLIGIESTSMLFYGIFSNLFPANNQYLQSNLYSTVIVIIVCVFILQILSFPANRSHSLFPVLILILAIADLTRYFWDVSLIDKNFTDQRWGITPPLAEPIRAALGSSWIMPDTSQGFAAGLFSNMPIANNFWPKNIYMYHQYAADLGVAPDIYQRQSLQNQPFDFYTSTKVFSNIDQIESVFQHNPGALLNDHVLLLQSKPDEHLVDTPIVEQNEDLRFDMTNANAWIASGMHPIKDNSNDPHNTWMVGHDPNLQYKSPLNFCFADYSYIFVRMAVSSDIVSPTVQFYYQLNNDSQISTDQSVAMPIWADGKPHTYAYDLETLQFDRTSRLTGIRLDPVFEGSHDGTSWAQILDFRLIHAGRPSPCTSQAVPGTAAPSATNFTYRFDEWRYNSFRVSLQASQIGWILIRQLDDPLWKLTLDGKQVHPIRANFVGMAIPIPQGSHELRMDYWPLARRLYWPAALLLEALLTALLFISLRKHATVSL